MWRVNKMDPCLYKIAIVLISKSVLQYERSPIIKRWNNPDFPWKRCKYCDIRWLDLSPELTGFFVARDVCVRVVGIGFEVAALLQNPAKELGLRIFWTIRTRPPSLLLLPAFLILRRTERAWSWWAMVSWSLVFPSFSFSTNANIFTQCHNLVRYLKLTSSGSFMRTF